MGVYPNWMFIGGTTKVPPPPELPKYDINQEAPKVNWTNLWYGTDPIIPHPDTPKTGGVPDSDDKPDWRGVIKNNVIPLKPPERYKFGNYSPEGYFWFDTPDYADPFKKLRYATYFMTKYGLSFACVYAIFRGLPFAVKTHIYLLKRPFARFWIGGMTASVAVITIANLRGNVDDLYNYFIGGFIGGAVVGRKNHISFLRQVFMWTIASTYVKYNAETNGKLMPQIDFRVKSTTMPFASGGDYGPKSGDFRYFKIMPEDPGRFTRYTPYA